MPPTSQGSATLPERDLDPIAFRQRLERTISGDASALGALFEAYGRQVYATVFRFTGNAADAEDATQELFVRLPLALHGFAGGVSSFDAWIRRVAVRQALVQLRAGRRRAEVSVDGVASLLAPHDAIDDRLTIQEALTRLSDEQRAVFLLKEVEGFAHTEIAEILGITVANSEVRLHRARRTLRELLRGSR